MARTIADCRRFESDSNCSLTIIGEESEVVEAATQHAVAVHGHTDTPEFRASLRATLEPEGSYVAGTRAPDGVPA
jgi:hypothetical protein